jgi:hypothetical protein
MGFTDNTEKGLLDYFIASYVTSTKYIGLSTTTPTRVGGNFKEPTEGSYARISTISTDWNAASGSAPATKSNSVVKTFPTALETWSGGANMTYFGIFDAASAGNVLATGAISVPKPVTEGDTPSFDVGSLLLELGLPSDVF